MEKKRTPIRYGFTLIELIVAVAVSFVVMLGVAVSLAESQKSWHTLYNRAFGDVVTDSHVARNLFNAVVRKASNEGPLVDGSGSWIEVYYYSDDDAAAVDRYARLWEAEGELNVMHGTLEPRETLTVETVCSNVSRCLFTVAGRSAQMILTLDDGSQTITTVSCAFMHNQ